MGLAIHLLGSPRVERDGKPLPPPRGHKVWGLLAYLMRPEVRASRSHLAALLFEDAEDPLATLRWNLSELRRLLGDVGLHGDVLELSLPPDGFVDVNVLAHGSWEEAVSVPGLGRELLEGMHFASSPSFDVWLSGERRRLLGSAEAILREAALARLASGTPSEAARLATRLVSLNPMDENFQALLVRSLAAAGDGVAAARQVAACKELFERELGIHPGATLAAALRTGTDTPTARPATGRAAALAQVDAGEAAIAAGALDAGLDCLRRAIVEADATGDPMLRTRARIALGSALVHAARGRDEEGATALHEALAVGQAASDPVSAAACRELGYVEFLRSRYERALVWLRRAASLAADDRAECARIATVQGSILSDTAHYAPAIEVLRSAHAIAESVDDIKQDAYTLSMLGRALLLSGKIDAARTALDRSIAIAQRHWAAFMPWPESLRAEIDLVEGDIDAAGERLAHAFALGCHLGDPCWEGIAGRGVGRVAAARGETQRAVDILSEAIARCVRLPDAYLWVKGHALDALCEVAVERRLPNASAWIDELRALASRGGMRELIVRSHVHRAAMGDAASGKAAWLLSREIDNPSLHALVEAHAPAGSPSAE